MKDLRQRLLATFRVEYGEHVARIRELLAGFEARGGAAPGPELDEAFRRAHSLKGASRAVDLRELEALAHRLESLLANVREGARELTPAGIGVIHQALDAGDDVMAALSRSEPAPDTGGVLAAIDRLLAEEPAPEPEPPVPAPVPVPEGSTPTAAPQPVTAALAPETPAEAETVRIPVAVLDHLLRLSGTLHTEVLHYEDHRFDAEAVTSELDALELGWGRLRQTLTAELRAEATFGRAGVLGRQVEQVETHVRELAHRQRALLRSRRRTDWSVRQLDEQLQEAVRRARLIPAESVFGGFRQLARETARDLGKEVRFQAVGLDVQADRAVLQELKDAVMHLLRNAIDHGLESPEERARAGKERAGSLSLAVETTRGRLRVTVADDGRGLDLMRIRVTAVQRGLLTAEEADTLTPEQLGRLILQPGFSTTRFVTEFSGRGMGLSVVAEAARCLQGEIDVLPGSPCGTVMIVSVPLSVSTRPLVTVEADGQPFALPSTAVSRLLHTPLTELRSLEGRPVLMVDEEPLPLAGLAHLLEIGPAELQPDDEQLSVVVLRSGPRRLGLVVDRFVAHTEAVLTHLGAAFADLPHLAGGFLGSSGEIVLALDAGALFERFDLHEGLPGLRIVRAESTAPPHILVVDDSITTRTLEKSVLEAHGYRVRVAVDGMEALVLLRAELPDLMIADVEMPRLDGFGLLEAVRSDPQLKALPVIMVTSLEKREHREKGLALGADAYIVKRHFDQTALLETIRRLL